MASIWIFPTSTVSVLFTLDPVRSQRYLESNICTVSLQIASLQWVFLARMWRAFTGILLMKSGNYWRPGTRYREYLIYTLFVEEGRKN